jgi:hypothetical protein
LEQLGGFGAGVLKDLALWIADIRRKRANGS